MKPEAEKRLNRVQMAARSGLAKLVYERELRIIDRLVSEYRGGTIKSEQLFGAIAAISELRFMATDAAHDYMQAEEEFSQLQAGAQNAES